MRELVEALKPFAAISEEGLAEGDFVKITTCREYFHRARAALAAYSVPVDVEGVVRELRDNCDCDSLNFAGCTSCNAASLIERLAAERDEAIRAMKETGK